MSASSAKPKPSLFVDAPAYTIRCRWLPGDEAKAQQAKFVRLIVDECFRAFSDEEGSSRRNFIQGLANEFHRVAVPAHPVLLMPAGTITAEAEEPLSTSKDALANLQRTMGQLDLGRLQHELLLGVDLDRRGMWLQSVTHFDERRPLSFEDIAVKHYPAQAERTTLWGWDIAQEYQGLLPTELTRGRISATNAGPVLTLVCHEAVLLSNRSRSNLKNRVAIRLRESLEQQLRSGLRFILMATHYIGAYSGKVFKSVTSQLSQDGFEPIVTTFAPSGQLEEVAWRFETSSPEVATLLVDAEPAC